MELSGFYGAGNGGVGSTGNNGGETDSSSLSNGESGGLKASSPYGQQHQQTNARASLPALKFHNHFPPDNIGNSIHDSKKDSLLMQVQELQGTVLQSVVQPQLVGGGGGSGTLGNRLHMQPHMRAGPEAEERVMLYVRQESEDVYTPLHVTPPTVQGLLNAVSRI